MKKSKLFCLILLVWLSITMAGCSRINKENYQKLEVGMSYQEVTELLGEPDQCNAILNAKSCVWQDKDKSITVRFIGDKTVLFSSEGI